MKNETLIAVLTGDLVGSSRMAAQERMRLLDGLSALLAGDEARDPTDPPVLLPGFLGGQLFRGDSFQLVLDRPSAALHAALDLLLGLRAGTPPGVSRPDFRLGIGIGSLNSRGEGRDTGTWSGEAFLHSGRLLDGLKSRRTKLAVASPWSEVDAELAVGLAFLNQLIRRWSPEQEYAIMQVLLGGRRQKDAALDAGVSQPAMARRLQAAGAAAVGLLLERFETLIESKLLAD